MDIPKFIGVPIGCTGVTGALLFGSAPRTLPLAVVDGVATALPKLEIAFILVFV